MVCRSGEWYASRRGGKDASANAILTDNITVNEGVLDAVNKGQVSESDFIEWKPIGTYDSYDAVYTGTFDGQGHTISGLYFNHPEASYVGLFGYIGANGKISNVGVSDSYFQFRMKGGEVYAERMIKTAYSKTVLTAAL